MKIDQPPPADADVTRRKLQKAAEDFTAVAIDELLKPIFETADTSGGPFGGGAAEQAFRPMMISQIAGQIARHGGLGLAQPVLQQMLRLQETQG